MADRHGRFRQRVDPALAQICDYAIVLVDEGDVIVGWNLGAERLLRYPEAEAIGQNVGILVTPEKRKVRVPDQELAEAASAGQLPAIVGAHGDDPGSPDGAFVPGRTAALLRGLAGTAVLVARGARGGTRDAPPPWC